MGYSSHLQLDPNGQNLFEYFEIDTSEEEGATMVMSSMRYLLTQCLRMTNENCHLKFVTNRANDIELFGKTGKPFR